MSHHHKFSSEMREPCMETACRFLEVDDPIKIPAFTEPLGLFFLRKINIHQMIRKCNSVVPLRTPAY